MSIATKTGDDGTTALLFKRRVSKTDLRVETYGTVDELNAALGTARALADDPFIAKPLFTIQKELVTLMAEMAVLPEDSAKFAEKGYDRVTPEMVNRITALIDDLEKNHKINFKGWATPGATQACAALDVARTICRRAERRAVELQPANPEIIRYLNRLSDLCWLYARFLETKIEKE